MANVPVVDHLPTEGGKWICGCDFAAHSNHQEADDCRLKEFRQAYVVEALARGWFCRACGVFNGDEKVFLTKCRNCEAARPENSAKEKCFYCDPNEQSYVVVTVHDRRGCVNVCVEHAKLRLSILMAYGHSLDCPMLREQL